MRRTRRFFAISALLVVASASCAVPAGGGSPTGCCAKCMKVYPSGEIWGVVNLSDGHFVTWFKRKAEKCESSSHLLSLLTAEGRHLGQELNIELHPYEQGIALVQTAPQQAALLRVVGGREVGLPSAEAQLELIPITVTEGKLEQGPSQVVLHVRDVGSLSHTTSAAGNMTTGLAVLIQEAVGDKSENRQWWAVAFTPQAGWSEAIEGPTKASIASVRIAPVTPTHALLVWTRVFQNELDVLPRRVVVLASWFDIAEAKISEPRTLASVQFGVQAVFVLPHLWEDREIATVLVRPEYCVLDGQAKSNCCIATLISREGIESLKVDGWREDLCKFDPEWVFPSKSARGFLVFSPDQRGRLTVRLYGPDLPGPCGPVVLSEGPVLTPPRLVETSSGSLFVAFGEHTSDLGVWKIRLVMLDRSALRCGGPE